MDQKIETTDAQRIFVCQNLGWKDHIQGEPFGQMVDIFEKYKVVCRYLPPLTLDWLHECETKLTDLQKTVYAETLTAACSVDVVDWGYYPGESQIDWLAVSNVIHATKEQRLAALVATLRL